MPIFQISSRIVQPAAPPKKRISHARRQWYAILWVIGGVLIVAALTILAASANFLFFFILMPVFFSLLTARSHLYNRKVLLLTICLGLIYFGGLTGWQLLIHGPQTPEIIIVTTTLAFAVLFEPVRVRVQAFFEQRFHLRDDEAIKAVEAFTSTLREEIDLNQVRERFLDVVQKTLQPQSVSVWVRTTVQNDTGSSPTRARWGNHDRQTQHEERKGRTQERQELTGKWLDWTEPSEVNIADHDPLIVFALHHPGAVEMERLQLDSPVLRILKINEVEIVQPLVSQGELLGLLALGPRLNGQEYTREDRSLLNTLAAQVAPALRVAYMVKVQQVQVRERERIEQELRTAQFIQHTFLPRDTPTLPGWQITTYYQPAREVGGDFYDFFFFEDGRLGLVIGDVTDKGMPAAMVMAATCSILRTLVQQFTSPGEVLHRANDLLYANTPSKMFVTCFYAVLNPRNGRIQYANAGHDLPYRRYDGSVSELRATGMPLGMMPDMCYDEYEVALTPGESVLFYSDGLVEAHNSRREMFGFPHLKTLLEEHSAEASLIDLLLDQLKGFTGEGWEQEDDVTMVVLHAENV